MGSAAWGGRQHRLRPGLRFASAVAALVWAGLALVTLRHLGYRLWAPVPTGWARWILWAFPGYTTLGVLLNLASRSKVERLVMTPVALILAVTLAIVAIRVPVAQ